MRSKKKLARCRKERVGKEEEWRIGKEGKGMFH